METLLNKFKLEPRNLSKNEKYDLCKYFRITKRYNFTDIKENFGVDCLISFLTFCNEDLSQDEHNEKLKNPYYNHFYNNNKIKNIDYYLDTIEEFYENCLKMNVDKNMIVQSYKQYKNGFKEGVMIKKEPYSSCYTINIFSLEGGDFDVSDGCIYNTKQLGTLFRFQSLPNKENLINSLMIYDLLLKDGGIKINTDISTFKAYKTANEYKF